MRLMSSKLAQRAQVFLRETHFVVTGVPSLGALHEAGSIIGGLNEMRQNSARLRAGLVTTCDVARSVCKPVDDLAGRRPTYGGYGYGHNSYTPPRPAWTPQPVPAATGTWINLDDKASMIRGAASGLPAASS